MSHIDVNEALCLKDEEVVIRAGTDALLRVDRVFWEVAHRQQHVVASRATALDAAAALIKLADPIEAGRKLVETEKRLDEALDREQKLRAHYARLMKAGMNLLGPADPALTKEEMLAAGLRDAWQDFLSVYNQAACDFGLGGTEWPGREFEEQKLRQQVEGLTTKAKALVKASEPFCNQDGQTAKELRDAWFNMANAVGLSLTGVAGRPETVDGWAIFFSADEVDEQNGAATPCGII